MADIVYPKSDLIVAWSQGKTKLTKTDPWDANAPLVRERPDLFTDEPERVSGRVPGSRIETATRAPGERRGPGRPRKTAP